MPRGRGYRRSLAAKKRESNQIKVDVEPWQPPTASYARHGTGSRHRVQKWPTSDVTGRSHKLVLPAESPDKKFILVVGDSHLRALADGVVKMPESGLSFGFMSTPGASAHDLRMELVKAEVPQTPAAVCLLAPSNNLTSSKQPCEAADDFRKLLRSACERWSNVVVLDFPPRLNFEMSYQEHMRQAFHRVAAGEGVRWFPVADKFLLNNTDLWARDGIHLSDSVGMPLLVDLLWTAVYSQVEDVQQSSQVQAPSRPWVPRFTPRVVVKGKEISAVTAADPSGYIFVGKGKKRRSSVELTDFAEWESKHKKPVKDCTIPLTPVWFSVPMLEKMDKISPSDLSSPDESDAPVPEGKPKAFVKQRKRATVSKMRLPRPEQGAAVSVGGKSDQLSPAMTAKEVSDAQCPQKSSKGQSDAKPRTCVCLENSQRPYIHGTRVAPAPLTHDVNTLIACSVVAAIKHVVAPVCTWTGRDVDEVGAEGKKLLALLAQDSHAKPKELSELIQQCSVFGREWKIAVGEAGYLCFNTSAADESLSKKLEEVLLTDHMCLLNINGSVIAVIQHNDYYVVVDCATRDNSGFACGHGTSVATFNTNILDLMHHITSLQHSLRAEWCGVYSMSVEALDADMEISTEVADSDVDTQVAVQHQDSSFVRPDGHVPSVQGTFHQGAPQFEFAGRQCMAISLAAIAKHNIDSVFSWQSHDLDRVVKRGDALYSSLWKNRLISAGEKFLCVTDLPRQQDFFQHLFQFEYPEDVYGDVDVHVVDGNKFVYTTLQSGLTQMCTTYDTCLFTLAGSTCAIIRQDGKYAVFDSHARDADGMIDGRGKSVVVYFTSVDHLFDHIQRFAAMLTTPQKQFEIIGVVVTKTYLNSSGAAESTHSVFESSSSEECSDQPVASCSSSENCTRSSTPHVSENLQMTDVSQVHSDVLFVCDVTRKELQFNPLSKDVAHDVCTQLNITCDKVDAVSSDVGPLGAPCTNIQIKADGNCFFRAVSQAVSGSQDHHRKIRQAVVKQLKSSAETYNSLLRSQYTSIKDYLHKSNMRLVGRWATEIEIQAAADCLGVNIYTYYNDRWLQYRCQNSPFSNQGVYLENCNGNHYETVVCIKQHVSCYGYCKVNVTDTTYNLRQRNKTSIDSSVTFTPADGCVAVLKTEIEEKQLQNIMSKYLIQKKKVDQRNKYRQMPKLRQKKLEITKNHYHKHIGYKDNIRKIRKIKYQSNVNYRDKVKKYNKMKYQENVSHREKVLKTKQMRYQNVVTFREKVKNNHKLHYHKHLLYKAKVKQLSKNTYHGNEEFRKSVVTSNRLKRQDMKKKAEQFDFVKEKFDEKVKDGPDFVCCVCHRLLFKHQVLNCKREYYNKKEGIAALADKCITEDYLHQCSQDCETPCQLLDSARGQLWICYTCHYKINKGEVPPESVVNNLGLDPVPEELRCLNVLERHLIALNIPFMKMLALPKGGQNGVHGPVTCVPANIVQTDNLLPRTNMEGSLLRVKLKRKLTYKGHYDYQFVDTTRVRQALQYLKTTNVHYKDIEFNEDWLNEFVMEQDEEAVASDNSHLQSGQPKYDVVDDELLHDRQSHCMYQDTCFMPVDLGQEMLDQNTDVLNLAPAEGNNPVRLLSDTTNEAKCFPFLFPSGSCTYHESRQHRLTLCRYLNNRILNADGRFAHCVEYLFFALYVLEIEQVMSKVSIALRKGKGGHRSIKVADFLKDEESLKKLLEFDDGYRFLKPIRGTPAFWQAAQKDLLACVRQLGIPTWFCSFSSADMRWKNLLNSILKQEGRTQTADQLDWAERCELLRRNPVTAARMFDFRWHCFLREVLMSAAEPIGKIVDYFYRVEYQQRGSPHIHSLFWIKDAPRIDTHTDEEVITFIDKYTTCAKPSDDDELSEVVNSVQQHSKTHTKTCKKKNTVCRFNFPRPASLRTFICRGKSFEFKKKCKCQADKTDSSAPCSCAKETPEEPHVMSAERAAEILTALKKAHLDEKSSFYSLEAMFKSVGIDQSIFEAAYTRLARNTHIVWKRDLDEVWINPYSKPLLKCWSANLDIQFVVDVYACIVYVVSYMSKAEREMGLLLGNAQREASKDKNLNAKEALKKLGSVYLHNRDVSAQEAVCRLMTNMHLKECSRKVVFVPTGDNVVKMSLPLKVLQQKASSSHDLTSEDMWMTTLADRYKNRPDDSVFNDMCMATFASEYRILSKNEKSKNRIQLQNNCGFILKRTRTQPAVVRYARFSETRNPELFYQSSMQLFFPYRLDVHLKPPHCETYEQFYKNGQICFSDGSRHSVKSVVDQNRKRFEMDADELDDIQNQVGTDGVFEDAWAQLCPELEAERLQCQQERIINEHDEEEEAEIIPDLAVSSKDVSHLEKRKNVMSRTDGLSLIRSLNEKQLSVFNQIRQWCLEKIRGNKPDPLHVFITGGAGTGKSHLIKAIQYEATRLLSTACHHPDNTCVLLTAPTGIAAYNLHATTIHSTLSIGMDVRLPYTPLGEEKVNSLRGKYSDLQILIIDEISMVDHRLLTYIHGRLRQIKQTGDFSPFGNVSVIAVGDFFQLPPVKGKALYVDDDGVNLWSSLFKVVELTTIVRQKDAVFAELLNRLRTRSKDTPMLFSDIQTLKQCETGEVSSALHIFPTNSQVNEHNLEHVFRICPEYIVIEAQDFMNSKKTGKLELLNGHHSKTSNTSLEETLPLGIGARVMLIKNVDVLDGLVNGVCGTVTHIVTNGENKFPQKVYVKFDDVEVGAMRRKQSASVSVNLMDSTGIDPEEENVTRKGGMRRQFPLKLAWACTVHKVQGLTVDNAVVSLKKIFTAGQAYVALSRVRSLSGLVIQDFREQKIYCKENIKDAMESMPPFLVVDDTQHTDTQTFNVFLMNVQNLSLHLQDLVACTQNLQLNCIAVTETWMPDVSSETIKIDGYSLSNCPRSLSYNSNNPVLTALQAQQRGGVGMFSADNVAYDLIKLPQLNVECLVYKYNSLDIVVAVIYRPPSYPMSLFKENLGKLLDRLDPLSNTIAVMGDFNDDILKSTSILNFVAERGYVQLVTRPTTERGTLIDHVYVKTTQYQVQSVVWPTYFSDHEGIVCSFKRASLPNVDR